MTKHKFLRILVTLIILWSFTPCVHGGWFDGGEQQEKDRREHAEQQLYQQEQKNSGMGVVIVVLAVACIAGLGIGAAVGSKTRRDAERSHEQ